MSTRAQEMTMQATMKKHVILMLKCLSLNIDIFHQRAIASYEPQRDDELAISPGDDVIVTSWPQGGWWCGSVNGRTGWFPANRLEPASRNSKMYDLIYFNIWLTGISAPSSSQSSNEALASQGHIFVRARAYTTRLSNIFQKAVVEFKGRYEDELSFNIGDRVNVLQVPNILSWCMVHNLKIFAF